MEQEKSVTSGRWLIFVFCMVLWNLCSSWRILFYYFFFLNNQTESIKLNEWPNLLHWIVVIKLKFHQQISWLCSGNSEPFPLFMSIGLMETSIPTCPKRSAVTDYPPQSTAEHSTRDETSTQVCSDLPLLHRDMKGMLFVCKLAGSCRRRSSWRFDLFFLLCSKKFNIVEDVLSRTLTLQRPFETPHEYTSFSSCYQIFFNRLSLRSNYLCFALKSSSFVQVVVFFLMHSNSVSAH